MGDKRKLALNNKKTRIATNKKHGNQNHNKEIQLFYFMRKDALYHMSTCHTYTRYYQSRLTRAVLISDENSNWKV